MQYRQQFNLRIDPETVAALKRLAIAMRRSQANVVRWLILAEATRLEAQGETPKGEQMHTT